MAAALNSFADKNGLHLLYDARVTRRLKTSGLSGGYSVREGLDRLLSGTGLTYEYAINDHWSVQGEYRYSDFGHLTDLPFSGVTGLAFSANRHLAQNQVQFGFSYKFDTFAPAPLVAKY